MFYDHKKIPKSIKHRDIRYPKGLNRLRKIRKALLPFLPSAIESLPLEEYDLVISTSSCVAKGAMIGPEAKHLCYIHSPMRYIWDQRKHYFQSLSLIPGIKGIIHLVSSLLRQWDTTSAQRVDRFIVNSNFVGSRVKKYYGRNSTTIAPPVDWQAFTSSSCTPSETPFFLVAGAFVSYKRFDIAIQACEALGVRLVVAGSGPDETRLREYAKNNTTFEIAPSSERWKYLMINAKALLFPALEDFGIVAIESMAAGTPVIAYRGGGALDFIVPQKTGEFFNEQNAEALSKVLKNYSKDKYNREFLTSFAMSYDKEKFLDKIRQEINGL